MELYITDRFLVLNNLPENYKKKFTNAFTFSDERSAYNRGGFDAKKIKKVKFYNLYKGTILFDGGLLLDLLSFIKRENIPIKITDERKKLDYQEKEYTYDEMRGNFNPDYDYVEHQIRALKKMLKLNKGIIKASTSSGKTSLMLAFCKMVNLKTLVLVNKKDLGRQIHDRFNEGGFPILYRDGSKKGKIEENASYVCTIGVAKELPNDFDIVIVDECHRASSETFQTYLKNSKGKVFYGFSATPEGNHQVDFLKVKRYLGNIIEEIGVKELIDNDVITYPVISFVELVMPKIPSNTEWASVNDICIVNNTDRNEKIKELVEKHDLPTLILVRNIEHGIYLERIIEDSMFVSGEDSSEVRSESIEKLTNGDIKVLIASNIFNEGISINIIRVLINAAGGKSRIEVIQRLGRALRKDKGKDEAIVYDFYDLGQRITQKHSKERMNIYSKVGFPVKVLES